MVFDVEHTGCKEQLILQLSWGMYKQDGTLLEMNYYYLEPTDYIYIHISPRASDKHHITFEALLHTSIKLKLAILLNEFMTDLTKCKPLVAHNMTSDLSTLNTELLRCDMINKIDINTFCTMAHTKTCCKCKYVLNRLKQPRLDELSQTV